jgi:hypothetical protein
MASSLDITNLINQMVSASKESLGKDWPAMDGLALSAYQTLAQTLVNIQSLETAGTLIQPKADLLLDMQKNTLQSVLLAEEGLGLLAVQNAINAALKAIAQIVNDAIGFTLL